MKSFLSAVAVLLTAVVVAGCAARRPVLYPSARVERVSDAALQADIERCEERGEAYDTTRGRDVARKGLIGTGTGAAIGAASGAIWGHAARGAAAGAAGGAAAGVLHGLLHASEPTPTYKSFVTACLQEQGYQVIGWR